MPLKGIRGSNPRLSARAKAPCNLALRGAFLSAVKPAVVFRLALVFRFGPSIERIMVFVQGAFSVFQIHIYILLGGGLWQIDLQILCHTFNRVAQDGCNQKEVPCLVVHDTGRRVAQVVKTDVPQADGLEKALPSRDCFVPSSRLEMECSMVNLSPGFSLSP